MTLFLIIAKFVKMPKTRKRSRATAKGQLTVWHWQTPATLQTLFFGFFQPNFRTASVNSCQPTAFHSDPICVHECSSISCSPFVLVIKRAFDAQSGVCCQFTAKFFLPFFGLGFDKRKGTQSFFLFFRDIRRFH